MPDSGNIFYAKGALAATNALQFVALSTFPAAVVGIAADPAAEVVPDLFDIGQLNILFTNIVGVASVTHFLSRNVTGTRAITPRVTDLLAPIGSACGVGRTVLHPYRRVTTDVQGTLWLGIQLDAGTATVEVILTGRRG